MITSVDELFAVLAASTAHADEEDVDLLAHALQCATGLRASAPDDVELQVAGLVHDIGTALVPDAPDVHARIGADAVRTLLGARVARLVAGHAEAKRYLVSVDTAYRDALSARSVVTLAAQGGPLDERAAAAFARGRDADALVALRRADDAAKVPGADAGTLDAWRAAVTALTASR
ncbi:MAG TPA: HD domain-containing protein [Acidimicrobiia bacterium]|nr:HD domain-containing protein [Acidimicrobiia bacterium]